MKLIRNKTDLTISLIEAPIMKNDILLVQINLKDITKDVVFVPFSKFGFSSLSL